MNRRHLIAALGAAVLAPGPARAEGHLETARAVELLRAGGLNLYIRHAITDRSQVDTGRRGDRAGQRNIDARGRAQAAALGEALRRLGVPIGRVWTSEVFRAADTAELAFGAANVHVLDVAIADDYTPRDAGSDAAAMRLVLARAPERGNDVHVGHIVPFGMIVGRGFSQAAFPEGSIGLLRPEGQRFAFLGVVSAEALITAAGLPTPWVS
jgi:phosphohistidine phosphatase SixA